MPKGFRKCKICGCDYEYCRTRPSDPNAFRWQDVACCAEHGAQYLRRVLEARGMVPTDAPKTQDAEGASKKKVRRKKNEPAQPTDDKEMA